MVGKRHFLWGRLDEGIREGEGPGLVVVPVVLPQSMHKGHKDLQPPSASSQPPLIRHNDLTGSSESQWQRGDCGVSMWRLNNRPGDSLPRNENKPYQLEDRNP